MKKIMALVLALAMMAGMATMAMAAAIDFKPTLKPNEFYTYDSKNDTLTKVTSAAPGDVLYIPVYNKDGNGLIKRDKKDEMKNHKVSVTVDEGKKVFDSASIVGIDLAENQMGLTHEKGSYYFVKLVTKANYVLDDQDLDMTLQISATKPNTESSDKTGYAITLSYETKTATSLFGIGEGNYKIDFSYADDEWQETEIFFGNDDVTFQNKMYKQPELFIGYSSDVIDKYETLYGDKAALEYHTFTMPKSFKQAGTLTIPAAMLDGEKTPYLYQEVDGKLVQVKNAYDKKEEAFVLKNVKTLGKYIVSDVDLKIKDTTGEGNTGNGNEENPETGANDVVAIAAGLAVVSLIAAGAVSLKK